MKIGVVVDARCDLPRSYIDEHRLIVLPNVLEVGEKEIIDSRDARETLAAYRRYVADKSLEARSRTLEVDAIRDLFLDDLIHSHHKDCCYEPTPWSSRRSRCGPDRR